MNTHIATPPNVSLFPCVFNDFYRQPQLPDEACLELQHYPWNRPLLKPVISTLLNLPCASARQLAGLTGIPVDQVEAELRAASQATAGTPRLVAPIGRIEFTGNIHPDLKAFIGDDELWAIDPRASHRLRRMAMVPTRLKPLRLKTPFDTQAGRGFLTTTGGVFVPVRDLLHNELTSALAALTDRWLPPMHSAVLLHQPLLQQAFGWSPLTRERAGLIHAGQPLWNIYEDCAVYSAPSIYDPDRPRRKIVLPMDLPDAWFVLRLKLTRPYLPEPSRRASEGMVTHLALGIRVEVAVTGKSSPGYVRLFQRLPKNQVVIYLVPSPRLRARIRKVAADFPQVFVPELGAPPEGSGGRPKLDATETWRAIHYAGTQGTVPYPLTANLFMAAQDAVFDLYRAA